MSKEKRFALLIFMALLFCYGYFFPRWADWNQNSRMDLTLAIVEQGTIRIDDYYSNTGDYAVHSGHIYTDKAPGTSFLGVPTYFVFRLVSNTPLARAMLHRLSSSPALAGTLREGGTGLLEQKVYFAAALYSTTFVIVSFPSALLGALLYLFLGRLLPSRAARTLLVFAYGLATIAFPYSTVFMGHQIAAALLFLAFYLLYRIRQHEISQHWLWGVGGLSGLAVLIEFPALVPLLILSLYALWFLDRKWEIVKIALPGLPLALILGWYNATAFGSPFASSYRFLGRFPEISGTGFLGFSQPSLEALWGITFSPYRGLFFLSPFLLLAIPGFWYLLREHKWRAEGVLWLSLSVAQLVLISAWYDWRGGFAIGPRNLLNTLPFMLPPIAACYRVWRETPLLRVLAWGLIGASFGLVWVASVSGQDFAPVVVANPLTDFFWPRFQAGDITRNLGMALGLHSWWSLLPPILIVGAVIGGTVWVFGGREKRESLAFHL